MSELLPVDHIIKTNTENDYSGSPFLQIDDDIGISLLCNAAERKNLEIRRHRRLIFEIYDEQRNVVFRQNSPGNSAVYTFCARKKHIAKRMLDQAKVPVPAGSIFNSFNEALQYFQQMDGEATVKPSDGSSGIGVSSGIATGKEFEFAWELARRESPDVIVEQNILGQDIRVIVIGGKAEAAYLRVPAHVIGDGVHSVKQLVERKNDIRRRNPSLRIDLLRKFDLMERRGIPLDFVPGAGEKIQLTSVANTSAGGETIQVFDLLDTEILEIAERAARCFPGLVQVGVDVIYSGATPETGRPAAHVIEVNSNPGICDAVFPSYGRPVDVPAKLLGHVFSRDPAITSAVGSGISTRRLQIALAPPYGFSDYPKAFYRGMQRQVDLIKQAAFEHNLEVDALSDTVYRIGDGTRSLLFHGAMPEQVRMVSRKITRNREWLNDVLPRSSQNEDDAASPGLEHHAGTADGNRYRICVVGNRVVAALYIHRGPVSGKRGAGTDTRRIDVSDLLHQSLLLVIEKTLKVIFDPYIAGIDLMMEDISRDIRGQHWKVVDAVCNPAIGWHHFPDQGMPRNIAAALLHSLFPGVPSFSGGASTDSAPIPTAPILTVSVNNTSVRVLVSGKVQGVGFRRWMKLMAIRHGVRGWVKNLADGRVEATLEGAERAVAQLCELCKGGPSEAAVEEVQVAPATSIYRAGFTVLGTNNT